MIFADALGTHWKAIEPIPNPGPKGPPYWGAWCLYPPPWIKGAWCPYPPPGHKKECRPGSPPEPIQLFSPKLTILCKCHIFRKNDMLFSKKKEPTHQGSLDKSYFFEHIMKWGLQTKEDPQLAAFFEPWIMIPFFSSIYEVQQFLLYKTHSF